MCRQVGLENYFISFYKNRFKKQQIRSRMYVCMFAPLDGMLLPNLSQSLPCGSFFWSNQRHLSQDEYAYVCTYVCTSQIDSRGINRVWLAHFTLRCSQAHHARCWPCIASECSIELDNTYVTAGQYQLKRKMFYLLRSHLNVQRSVKPYPV